MFGWPRPVTFVNGQVLGAEGRAFSMRFDSRIRALGRPPVAGDEVVDLDGAFVLPGLINAHDHLELNHYGPLVRRARYTNASDWIDDLRPVIREDPAIVRASRHALGDRLFIGGLKNLLAGATTVAHHNPIYRGLRQAVPVRVVTRFTWAHSLAMQDAPVGAGGEPGGDVRRRFQAAGADVPFIVHASEGTDARAAGELPRLLELGCVGPNVIMVHGVAWSLDDWQQVLQAGAALAWCPASNARLFGRTARVADFLAWSPESGRHICLGSDSRLTGARDLLDELRAARETGVEPDQLLPMVTSTAARLLRLADAGSLRIGGAADFVVVPATAGDAASALLQASRHDLTMVAIGGRPMVGSERLRPVFEARRVDASIVEVDGHQRLCHADVARAIARCPILEPGVQYLGAA